MCLFYALSPPRIISFPSYPRDTPHSICFCSSTTFSIAIGCAFYAQRMRHSICCVALQELVEILVLGEHELQRFIDHVVGSRIDKCGVPVEGLRNRFVEGYG